MAAAVPAAVVSVIVEAVAAAAAVPGYEAVAVEPGSVV